MHKICLPRDDRWNLDRKESKIECHSGKIEANRSGVILTLGEGMYSIRMKMNIEYLE